MKKNTFNNQKGEAIILLVVGIGALGFLLSGFKAGEVAYEKIQADAITEQFQEQAQYLAEQAPRLGKSGDLAVQESFRLNEASKKIKEQGLQIYSQKMMDEAVGLGTGLGLGKTIELAGKTGKVINFIRDIKAIGEEGIAAYKYSEADLQIWETIKGSRDNIDDFHLAMYKAEIDEVARMKTQIQESSDDLEELFRRHEEAQRYWEESKKAWDVKIVKRAEEEMAKIREQTRVEALKDETIKNHLNWQAKAQKTKDQDVRSDSKGNVANLANMSSNEIAEKVDKTVVQITKKDEWNLLSTIPFKRELLDDGTVVEMKQWYLSAYGTQERYNEYFYIHLFDDESRKIKQIPDFKAYCAQQLSGHHYSTGGSDNQYEFCSYLYTDMTGVQECHSAFVKDGLGIRISDDAEGKNLYHCTSYIEEFLEVFDSI